MPNSPENHPQLPGLETQPPEDFDSAKVAADIAASSERHQDAIARRYDKTSRRYYGTLPESDEDDKAVEVSQDAGSSAVADVVSIDHIDEDPTREERRGAQGRHPASSAGVDKELEGKSRVEQIRIMRDRLARTLTPEQKAEERRRQSLENSLRRSQDPTAIRRLPRPPVPPRRPNSR